METSIGRADHGGLSCPADGSSRGWETLPRRPLAVNDAVVPRKSRPRLEVRPSPRRRRSGSQSRCGGSRLRSPPGCPPRRPGSMTVPQPPSGPRDRQEVSGGFTDGEDRVPRRPRLCASTNTNHAGSSNWPESRSPKYGFCRTPDEAREGRRADRRARRRQVPGSERRPDEGRRRQVRRHARRGRRACRRNPGARDRRRPAARGPRRPEGRRQAGVLRGRRLGRHREAAADALQRMGGIDIEQVAEEHPDHVGPRSPLEPHARIRLPRQAGGRRDRGDRPPADPRDAGAGKAGSPLSRARHDTGRDQPARRAHRRQLRRARRPHGDGKRGQAAAEGAAGPSSKSSRGHA